MGAVVLLRALVSTLFSSPLSAAEFLTFTNQDVARTAVLHRPAAIVGREVPLVIAVHGTGGSGEGLRAYFALDAVADREKFGRSTRMCSQGLELWPPESADADRWPCDRR